MRLPGPVENHPDYVLLSEHFDEETVERIIASGIPINRVGVVPSLMVPPGRGCEDIATEGLTGLGAMLDAAPTGLTRNFVTGALGVIETWDPRHPAYHLSEDILGVASDRPRSQVPEVISEIPKPDPTLEWVEQNWLMLAAGLGALLVLGMATRK